MFHSTVPTAKTFDANDMERHVCAHFAEPKGRRNTDEAKRQRVESAGDAFGALMDAEQQQRTPSTCLQRGRLHRAMHDATFGVVDKVVPTAVLCRTSGLMRNCGGFRNPSWF